MSNEYYFAGEVRALGEFNLPFSHLTFHGMWKTSL
jgi:hypothetical protein